jgi:hypothetical protein
LSALTAGIPPHATVILAGGEVNVGAAAGVTVIVLTAVIVLPHASVAFHVSVTGTTARDQEQQFALMLLIRLLNKFHLIH